MSIEDLEVPAHLLNNRCDPDTLSFTTTEEVPPLGDMIGQERALSALELALNIQDRGFNLFISGLPGTGRNTALRFIVEQVASRRPPPFHWGYVHNFQDLSQPVPISLPCGWVKILAGDMDELVSSVRRASLRVFEGQEYAKRTGEALRGLEAKRQAMAASIEMMAREAEFALVSTPAGFSPLPLRNGQPLSNETLSGLSEEERGDILRRSDLLMQKVKDILADMRRLDKAAAEESLGVDREVVRSVLSPMLDDLKDKYAEFPDVVAYLGLVLEDMVEHCDQFKPVETESEGPAREHPGDGAFARYRVNYLLDNITCQFAPIIVEPNPTYYNLFGRIDYEARSGVLTTDHMMIKAGALHEANGGYLILQARDLLDNPLSWQTLKRVLNSGEVRIENIGEQNNPLPSSTLRPKPIPVDAKIVLVGTPDTLRLLRSADEDFRRLFKVWAEFDTMMDRTPENVDKYAAFVSARQRGGSLMPFHKTAVARIIEYSSRLAEHQEKLTTRFNDVSDIITEANYWAATYGEEVVVGEHVKKAEEQRKYRSGLREDRLQELIEDRIIRISTEGEVVGQINALAVLGFGASAFGKPSRITARVSLGRGQLVNVEREIRLSGKIHDKGFMVLTGYLRGKYGYDKPLSLSASISFEQSYSEVDGDSASSAELCALLSAISGLPIAQGIGITGAVNQNGDIQAIGGATQKIEGFFDICQSRGLTNGQGVIVPRDNLKHLALNEEVIEAVEAGTFSIYGVSTVDEGMEILTGVPAGEWQEEKGYPDGTLHSKVEQRLRDMAKAARRFSRSMRDGD